MIHIHSTPSKLPWYKRLINWALGLWLKDGPIQCPMCRGKGIIDLADYVNDKWGRPKHFWTSEEKKREIYLKLVQKLAPEKLNVFEALGELSTQVYTNEYDDIFTLTVPCSYALSSVREEMTLKLATVIGILGSPVEHSDGHEITYRWVVPKWKQAHDEYIEAIEDGEALVERDMLDGECCPNCFGTRAIIRLYKCNAEKRRMVSEENDFLLTMNGRGKPWSDHPAALFTNEGELPTDVVEEDEGEWS